MKRIYRTPLHRTLLERRRDAALLGLARARAAGHHIGRLPVLPIDGKHQCAKCLKWYALASGELIIDRTKVSRFKRRCRYCQRTYDRITRIQRNAAYAAAHPPAPPPPPRPLFTDG